MDEEAMEFSGQWFSVEEIDIDYEFDAPRYYDLSRPETDVEATEAELWFESAVSYPPSPFAVKLSLRFDNPMEYVSTSPKSKGSEDMNTIPDSPDATLDSEVWSLDNNNRGSVFNNQIAQDISESKNKFQMKSSLWRSSTLMKPTASLLAKQNQRLDVYSSQHLRRCQRSIGKFDDKSSLNAAVSQRQATKRQKLEAGYLWKVAHLKHQTLFVHKVPKKVGSVNSQDGRPKVTVPREPELETAQRAQRHRTKTNAQSAEQVKLSATPFKARPLNRKILEASWLPLPRRSTPRLQEFQEFRLRTSERAMQRASNYAGRTPTHNSVSQSEPTVNADTRMLASVDSSGEEKSKEIRKSKSCPHNRKISSSKGETDVSQNVIQEDTVPKEIKFPRDRRFQDKPLTEVFDKLSLASNTHYNIDSQSKMPAEIVNTVKEKSERFRGKQNPCGTGRAPEIGQLLRSLDIC